jgi:Zn finger protein HypA/HybF involved in hydrogenase expression
MRKRTWTDEQLVESVKKNASVSDVIRDLGLEINTGGNYCSVKNAVKRLGLDISHWLGSGHLKGKTHNWTKKKPLNELLVVGRYTSTSNLKRRLVREGVLKNVCSECGKLPFWNDKPLVLVLDHINGINDDNSLDNLRLLCPDCNSQQPTFCNGANKIHRMSREKLFCSKCGKELKEKRKTGLCIGCIRSVAVPELA